MGMRWSAQQVTATDVAALPGLESGAIPGLVRTVSPPGFAGISFHEVLARSVLNHVPGGAMPFSWTVNPYRGCSHACVYCFARGSHEWLELDTGTGFDREIVVKTNVAEVLRRELARPGWGRERVALGTNTDPYQRAEGRYRLMPGVLEALAGSGTPISVLTKGPLLRRDLPLLAAAAQDVPVWIGVSIAIVDEELHTSLEPGTPGPRARLDLVRAIRGRGLPCRVMLAPVLPWLTDQPDQLAAAIAAIAAAGASSASVMALHLRPATKTWFIRWLARERPELVGRYEHLYAGGAYAPASYRDQLAARVDPLLRQHGLVQAGEGPRAGVLDGSDRSVHAAPPSPSSPSDQLRLV